jgi:hypothetical protein
MCSLPWLNRYRVPFGNAIIRLGPMVAKMRWPE